MVCDWRGKVSFLSRYWVKQAVLIWKDSIEFCASVIITNKTPFSLFTMWEFLQSRWVHPMADESAVWNCERLYLAINDLMLGMRNVWLGSGGGQGLENIAFFWSRIPNVVYSSYLADSKVRGFLQEVFYSEIWLL